MTKKLTLLLLRLSMGWLMFYAGLTKILNPQWSAAGYLKGAKTFSDFYAFFLQDKFLPLTNLVNEWGLAFIGVALILGIFVRPAAVLGAILMLLYYFPILEFPYAGEHYYIIDDHIIFALAFLVLAGFRAGRHWGIDKYRG